MHFPFVSLISGVGCQVNWFENRLHEIFPKYRLLGVQKEFYLSSLASLAPQGHRISGKKSKQTAL